MTIADILDFADTCSLEDIRPVLDTQIQYNTLISEEGLLGDYGANIGSHHAQVLRRRRPQPGHRQGCRRLRRPDERLRAAGGHQLGQRQPGHHGVGAGDRVRQGPGRPQGPAVPGPGGLQPHRHPRKERHRSAVRLLAARSAPGAPPAAASPICRGRTTKPLPTPWSTRWPSSRASSATGPSPAAPPRSPPAWRPASWATTWYLNGQQFRAGGRHRHQGRREHHPQRQPAGAAKGCGRPDKEIVKIMLQEG